jgi:UDP-N-acetylmuramoyl-tripeptide--D-alanyl-D-alanine ligase
VSDVARRAPSGGVEPTAAPSLSAADLVAITGGTLLSRSTRPIRGASVDSRTLRPGQLFVALPGERTDGHAFLADAVAAGAAGLVVSRPVDSTTLGDISVVLVRDGLAALQAIAAAWRTRFAPLVVGVTGSIAKTSTKEAIASVLGTRYRTLKNEGNLNNEIGLPVTVLGMGPEHKAAVLEMGMYVGGEIRQLARIARPQIGVVTAVQPVHLSRIGTIEAVERAKGELVEELPPADEGGAAVLNADDERVRRMSSRTRARSVTYGFAGDADVRAEGVESAGLGGMRFVLVLPEDRRPVSTPALGRLSVHNALAAVAVGHVIGLDLDEIEAGLAHGWSAPHRTQVVEAGGVTIVDDSYNASPASVTAALELMSGVPGRHVAVLGEMLELGNAADEGHREVGRAAADVCDLLLVVGAGAREMVRGAVEAGMPAASILSPETADEAVSLLERELRRGDVVLVKASRGIALEQVVDGLAARLGAAERAVR